MRLFRMEAKKMMIYQSGFFFLILFFVLWTAVLILFDTPAQPNMETGKVQLAYYLEQMGGKCTSDSKAFISDEAERIGAAKSSLQRLQMLFFDGKLSKAEFDEQRQPYSAVTQNSDGFALLFEQYTYAREDTENRYLLYTNGWAGLLTGDEVDLLFLLLLLLLMTPIFCAEAQGKMDLFLMTTPKGGRDSTLAKIVLSLLTAALLSLALSALQYGFFAMKYGLPHGDYPLQSLSFFATSSLNLTLDNAFWMIAFFRLVGSICFTAVILFVSACVKNYALSLFVCITTVVLPAFLFPLSSTKYFLPSPLGFLIGSGFLRGTAWERNLLTDEMIVIFREIPQGYRLALMLVLLGGCIGMQWFVMKRYSNRWETFRPHRRKTMLGLTLCLSLCLLTGCASQYSEPVHYTLSENTHVETADYLFYSDIGTDGKQQILCKDKHSNIIRNLPLDPFDYTSELADCLFGQGNFVYYLKYDMDHSGVKERQRRFCVIQVDTTDFTERVVFERQLYRSKLGLFANADDKNAEARFWMGITAFFLNRDYVYFVRGDSEVIAVSRLTGKRKTIAHLPIGAELSFDGRNIIYQNADGETVRYDSKTEKVR